MGLAGRLRALSGSWGIIRFLFRAAHDQRFAAGPRQGHFVLDPEKCRRIFPLTGGGNMVGPVGLMGRGGFVLELKK